MSFLLAVAVVAGFGFGVSRLGVLGRAREAGTCARASLAVVRDRELSDAEKELALRRTTVRLLGSFFVIVGGTVVALGLPLGGAWLASTAGVGSWDALLAILQRMDFLVLVSVIGLVGHLLVRRSGRIQ